MKAILTLILLLFLTCNSLYIFAQTSTYPAPRLYYVTVNPETGHDSLIWFSITGAYPEIDYYIVGISTLRNPGEFPPDYGFTGVGQVFVPDTVFINTNLESSVHSVGYTVWGVNDLGGGPTTIQNGGFEQPPDSTIFLEVEFDTCLATITLNWNDYNKWRGTTDEFNIYRRTAPNVYSLIDQVSGTTTSYVMTNVTGNQTYELFVEAVNSDRIRRSTSNRVDVLTTMSLQPNSVNADYATLSAGNSIDLSFTILGTPFNTQYNLVRSISPAGSDPEIVTTFITSNNRITYTDNVPFTSGIYYYHLEGINNCGQASSISNTANNIILNGTLAGTNISVSWNEYEDWSGDVQRYRIIRTSGRENPVTDTIDLGSTTTYYIDDIGSLANYADPVSSLVCYQVDAIENINMYGWQGKSLSNRLCFSLNPDIRMPNAFIPNDGDATNQVFEPVFSFEPEQYEMTIYNRLGTKIWEGSEPWDGRANGKYVPEGVYLYYVRVYNYSTDYTELNGSVTVLYR